MTLSKRSLRLTVVAASAVALWVACSQPDVHALIAGQYIAGLDCVTPGYVIDALNGPPVDAACEATCLMSPFGDGAVYITGACAPYSLGDEVNPDSSLCTKGIAAIKRSDLCLEAGPSHPLVDAGHEASDLDARAEASADADHD